MDFTSDFRAAGADQHVHLAAHSELRQVNAGLDREARIRQDATLVVDLKIVHIGAIRVNFGADRMAGAVNKIVAVAGLLDVRSHRAIHFPASNGPPGGNAIQYGFHGTPINVTVQGEPDDIILSVHNEGIPIPPDRIGGIFTALTRDTEIDSGETTGSMHLGLGLYITREIVAAHGGKIAVTSTEKDGTTFMANFPRHDNNEDEEHISTAEVGASKH